MGLSDIVLRSSPRQTQTLQQVVVILARGSDVLDVSSLFTSSVSSAGLTCVKTLHQFQIEEIYQICESSLDFYVSFSQILQNLRVVMTTFKI